SQAYGRNSGQCSLIDAMSPALVPTRSQNVPDTRYSKVTRTVAGSTDVAAMRPGSRIRVLIALSTRAGNSNARAKPKRLVLLRGGPGFASFSRTAATFLSDLGAVSVTGQPDDDGHDHGDRPAERERAAGRRLRPQHAPAWRHDDVAVAEARVVDRRVIEG